MGVYWTWLFTLPWRIWSILSVLLWVGEHVQGFLFTQCQSQGPSNTVFLKTRSLLPLKPLKLGFPWPQTSYPESPRGSESIRWGRPSLSIALQMQNHPSSVTISLSLSSFSSMACITMETTIHWWCVHVFLPQLESTLHGRRGLLFGYHWLWENVTKHL